MKNDIHNQIKIARDTRVHKAPSTDILVNSEVVQRNIEKLAVRPRRKRRIDYAKKIMNDDFIMNV